MGFLDEKRKRRQQADSPAAAGIPADPVGGVKERTMVETFFSEVCRTVPGRFRRDEPMAERTTIRIGGPAEIWAEPRDEKALQILVKKAREADVPWSVVGRGSNILVSDRGIKGIVINLNAPSFCGFSSTACTVRAGAGLSLSSLLALSVRSGLSGLESLEGIPGTVGGALRMNAGAFGFAIGDRIKSVRCLTGEAVTRVLSRKEVAPVYRESPGLSEGIVLAAEFELVPASPKEVAAKLAMHRARRRRKYPSIPSAGSVFRNPEGLAAGALIEMAGLKGLSSGKAVISARHANFIVNRGGAKAEDVLFLIETIQRETWKKMRVRLETEIVVMGETNEGSAADSPAGA